MRPPKGGIDGVLAAVDRNRDEVVAGLEFAGQPGLERRVSVLVRRDLLAVEEDSCIRHRAVEDKSDLPTIPRRIGAIIRS